MQYGQLLATLGKHEAREGFALTGALMNIGLAALRAQMISVALAAIVLAGSYCWYRYAHDERTLFCAAVVASLVASPVLWSHYLVLLFALLLVAGAPRRWLLIAAVTSWAIAPPHGLHLDTDLIEGIASSATWLVVGVVSTVAILYSRFA